MVPACSMGSWLKLSPASKRASRAQLLAARARRPRIVSCPGYKHNRTIRYNVVDAGNRPGDRSWIVGDDRSLNPAKSLDLQVFAARAKNFRRRGCNIMKTKSLFISILAVLFAFPLPGAFAQEASDSISIQVIATFDYPGDVTQTVPSGINDRGDVTGFYVDSSGVTRGFVRFANGTFSAPIVEPNDTVGFTEARGITDQRLICGWYIGSDEFAHGYFLNRGVFTEFDVDGANQTIVDGVNDAGDFVGNYTTETVFAAAFSNIEGIAPTRSSFQATGEIASPMRSTDRDRSQVAINFAATSTAGGRIRTAQFTPRLILLTLRRRCHSESMTRVGSWEDS